MAHYKPLPFRRRTFLVKHGFQVRFAVYPILFLAAFLLAAGVYLYDHLQEVLRLQLYLPHSRLQDPWQVVAPAVHRVAAWGGAAFLVALTLWVWGRFTRLRRDLERLADWLNGLCRGAAVAGPPALADREVGALAKGLWEASQAFDAWEGKVRAQAETLVAAVERARGGAGEPRAALKDVRKAWGELRDAVAAVRVEEDLS